jgi:Asp/Glu/hydantoin racemase
MPTDTEPASTGQRILLVPPYRGAGYAFEPDKEPYYRTVLDRMRASGLLAGAEVSVDPGVETLHRSASRDDDVFDHIGVATLDRVKELAATGDHDAIVVLGAIDVGFHAMRAVLPIPVVHTVHASLHMASLISERFSLIDVSDPQAARVRRLATSYGFGDKLIAVRPIGTTSTDVSGLLRGSDPMQEPQVQALVERVVECCRAAVETDRADSIIMTFTPLQVLEPVIRRRLDEEGYDEIPLIWILSASVAMARALLGTGLTPARRSYPVDTLRAKPAWR